MVNDFLATKKLRVIGATRVFYIYNITLLLVDLAKFNHYKSNVLTSENLSRAVGFLSRVRLVNLEIDNYLGSFPETYEFGGVAVPFLAIYFTAKMS